MSTANIEDFLPAIFRKIKRAVKPAGQDPAVPNILASSGGVDLQQSPNIAAPQDPTPVSRTTGQTMDENVTRPRRVETDTKGRPIPQVNAIDPDQQATEYNQRLNAYQPEKAKGWWDRYLRPALIGAGQGFLAGGPGGAIGGAGFNALEGAVNPARGNEQWKNRKLGESNRQMKGIEDRQDQRYKREKTAADLTKTEADTNLANVRAKAASQPKPGAKHYIERTDGVYEVSDANPDGRKVGNVPAEAKTKNANPTRYFERADGVYGVNDEHPQGFRVAGVPGKPDSNSNSAIETNIAEMTKEKNGIGEALKTTPAQVDDIDPLLGTVKGKKPNPAYVDYMNRFRKLDDDIRQARTQKKQTRSAPKSDPLGLFSQ